MPHKEESQLEIVELHPTFAAEVRGTNFHDLGSDVFDEIHAAITKVRPCGCWGHGIALIAHVRIVRSSQIPQDWARRRRPCGVRFTIRRTGRRLAVHQAWQEAPAGL